MTDLDGEIYHMTELDMETNISYDISRYGEIYHMTYLDMEKYII